MWIKYDKVRVFLFSFAWEFTVLLLLSLAMYSYVILYINEMCVMSNVSYVVRNVYHKYLLKESKATGFL